MAKKDELEFEGGIDAASKPNNSEKLKALQAAMDKIEDFRKRLHHENGR